MSEEKKHIDELEELSLLLDELNAGRHPECDSRETAELLAVAGLIKKTGGPVCPPQHILDQTVDRALAGIQAGKSKPSRAWWYSGALGTAAAVILVFGLNLLPSWQQQVPAAPPPATVSQQPTIPQPKPEGEQPPPVSPAAPAAPIAPAERPKPADTAPAVRQQAPANEQQKNLTVAQVPPAEPSKPPAATKEKSIMAEEARTSQSKSAYSPPPSFPDAAQSPPPAITPLALPGQKPDLVVTDKQNGTLRQIYFKGTPQEVTITQRSRPKDTVNVKAKSQAPNIMQAPDDNPDAVNMVRVTIADQEVTIEGRQSRQELLKLAESLTP